MSLPYARSLHSTRCLFVNVLQFKPSEQLSFVALNTTDVCQHMPRDAPGTLTQSVKYQPMIHELYMNYYTYTAYTAIWGKHD